VGGADDLPGGELVAQLVEADGDHDGGGVAAVERKTGGSTASRSWQDASPRRRG
jgi:hypothetical protein